MMSNIDRIPPSIPRRTNYPHKAWTDDYEGSHSVVSDGTLRETRRLRRSVSRRWIALITRWVSMPWLRFQMR